MDKRDEKWQRIMKRIERIHSSLSRGEEYTEEDKKRIFKERAVELSVRVEKREAVSIMKFITFIIGKEQYGIDVSYALESFHVEGICKVPGIPDYFFGLTNLRGEILTVINIQEFLGMKYGKAVSPEDVIVVMVDNIKACIAVDKILGIIESTNEILSPPLTTLDDANRKFIKGEVSLDNSVAIILDIERIMMDDRMFIMQNV